MKAWKLGAAIGLSAMCWATGASASDLTNFTTIFDTDYAFAGYGGMRGIGTGAVTLSGVTGPVTKAYLYWHGPANPGTVPLATANATVNFNGNSVTGTFLGASDNNCWGFADSLGYRADVTSLVTGNGVYSLANFLKPGVADINGVSLITFFDDGISANNRDVVIFDGNDSNIANAFDAPGWNISLNGINYSSGNANIIFGVSDGQSFADANVIINGSSLPNTPVVANGSYFDGNSVPNGPGGPSNGGLWDIRSFDLTSFLNPGINNLNVTTGVLSDCLSCIHILIDLPAGAAPPVTGVPEPESLLLLLPALFAMGRYRTKLKSKTA
jgi:hypothetical protein